MLQQIEEENGWAWKLSEQVILRLRRQHAQLFDISEIDTELSSELKNMLAEQLRAFLEDTQAECRLLIPPSPLHWQSFVQSLGITSYEKIFYTRNLEDPLPEIKNRYRLQPLTEIGEAEFVTDLALSVEGDPEAWDWDTRDWDAQKEFLELKNHADSAFDANNWFRVLCEEQPIGLLLPQVYPDKPVEGTIFYLGVFPAFRQQSHGQALHRLGLRQLHQRGVSRYVGSTRQENLAMQRIFEKNGCQQTRRLIFLRG